MISSSLPAVEAKLPSGPKMLAYEIPFSTGIIPCDMNRTLALDVTDDLRPCIFRRNRYHHMHVIVH